VKAKRPMGHSRARNRGAKGSVCSARSLRSINSVSPDRSGAGVGLVGHRRKDGGKEMQTRRTSPDHHQEGFASTRLAYSSPEAELIALARGKGQPLTQHTLRLICDTLELRGVTLEVFVADVRLHFRNNILNPNGFLIHRARQFHQLSRAAVASAPSTSVQSAAIEEREVCKGQKYVIKESNIQPCPGCSTPESRARVGNQRGGASTKNEIRRCKTIAVDDQNILVRKSWIGITISVRDSVRLPASRTQLPKDLRSLL
jgi:hypothetical protein